MVEGLGEMFEGDSADMCGGKFLLMSMGGLACADPGAMTPIGVNGNLIMCLLMCIVNPKTKIMMCFNSLNYSYLTKIAFT